MLFLKKVLLNINFKKYIYLVFTSNFFSILFLNDTTSFNLGLISIQSIIYSINNFLFITFIILETISSYLDFYGLTLNFLKLIFTNPNSLNFNFNFYIFFINFKYFLFLISNLIFLNFFHQIEKILKDLLNKKIFILILMIIFISMFTLLKENINYLKNLNDRILKKLIFISNGNFLRNDNWYIVLNNTLDYSDINKAYYNFSFEKEFKNFKNTKNIYIIINESYPNFKNQELKKKLFLALTSDLSDFNIYQFKKNWSKDYSTQGSEKELFCDQKGSWSDFKKDLNFFLKKNKCWINIFRDRYNIFIHTYDEDSFTRSRYSHNNENSFFDKSFFKEDLLDLEYTVCEKNVYYKGICEDQIINKLFLEIKKIDKKKLIIYLTVENHIPIKINNNLKFDCNNRVLDLHPQFCSLFNNQLNFNKQLNNFIKKLEYNDLLVFFSDTPPLYSIRDRVNFEDYIDVFFFKKK